MPRRPFAALGNIPTPHGDVIVRKVWKVLQHTFVFQFEGSHLALRWMLPTWKPSSTATKKTQATPPEPITSADEIAALFATMQATWQRRMQGVVVPSPIVLPSGVQVPYQTLAQLRELVDTEISSSLRASTVSAYRNQWKGIFTKIPDTTAVIALNRSMIQDAISALLADGLAAATVRRDVEALGRLLARAVEDGVLAENPVSKVRLPKTPKRVPRFLTSEQRQTLLAFAEDRGRDAYLLIALAVYLGLRKAELGALRWEQVDLNQKVVHIVNQEHFTTKNAKNRAVPICEELLAILTPHAKDKGFVLKPRLAFETGKRYRWEFKTMFDNMIEEANLPSWVTPHVLRHTFASLAAQSGISLYKIGVWMGHSMTEVTEIYAHLAAYDADINMMVTADPAPTPGAILKLVK